MHPFSLITTDAGSARWKQYSQRELGFTIDLPADPVRATSIYRTALVPSASASVFSHKQDDALFAAAVVDLADRDSEGAILIGEAESMLTQLGDVVSISVSRVQSSSSLVYGRLITLHSRAGRAPHAVEAWFKSNTGADPIHPSRVVANLFFNRKRLYLLHGISFPGSEDASSFPAVLQFVNSIALVGEDADAAGAFG